MSGYFRNIKEGFRTTFEGLSITLATMFARKETIEYPDADISSAESLRLHYKGTLAPLSDIYRGILKVDLSRCTACQICQKACPIDCIVIDNAKCDKTKLTTESGEPVLNRFTQKEALKTRTATRFDINAGKCMYCGLCVLACPTEAITHSKKFEMNMKNIEDLVLRFVSDAEKQQAEARAEEIEAEAAAKKAKKDKDEGAES